MQQAGLKYDNLLNNYNNNQADAVNENIYNEDSKYKYIRPFSEGYINSVEGSEMVEPGTKDYLYASQGSRSMHRKWWLFNRVNYFNGKYLSSIYKNDKYVMRLYTPEEGQKQYIPQYDLTKEEFDNNRALGVQYYIASGPEEFTLVLETDEYDANQVYYIYFSESAKLDASLIAVPPNNDFTLTPLYNQYLSIAFGGSNGNIAGPTLVSANKAQFIPAPSGSKYNDTETYLYGGSMLKDLGDLSTQYLGQFHFPDSVTKLEKLILGNPHNDYYNPNFSSLTIGESAPYLKELEISNCSGLRGRSLDLSKC
jgi:hypothetical protein